MKKISVIVPIYRVEKYIERCLLSLFNQTMTNGVEFILINDCTPDSSFDIAKKVASRYKNLDIIFVENKVNKGISETRKIAIDKASGEYIIQIDSDDFCENTMLEDMYNLALKDNSDVVVADVLYMQKDGNEIYQQQAVPKDNIKCVEYLIRGLISSYLVNKLIRRSIYTKYKVHYMGSYIMGEDSLAVHKIFVHAHRISYINKAYYHYFYNESSITKNLDNRALEEMVTMFDEIVEYLKANIDMDNKDIQDAIFYRKVVLKFFVLKETRGNLQKKIAEIYPEATPYIKCNFRYGKPNLVAFLLAVRGHIKLANIIWDMIRFKNRMLDLI